MVLLFGGGASSTPRTRATVCLRPRLMLRPAAAERSFGPETILLKVRFRAVIYFIVASGHVCSRQNGVLGMFT